MTDKTVSLPENSALSMPHATVSTLLRLGSAFVHSVRVPYLEHLLALVQCGCEQAAFPTASEPAFARAHVDPASYFVGLLIRCG